MAEGAEFTKSFPVSWEELHRHAKALAWRLAEAGPWTGIVAITRGGLVPAAILARELDVRLIDTVCVSSYDHQDLREPRVLKPHDGDGDFQPRVPRGPRRSADRGGVCDRGQSHR